LQEKAWETVKGNHPVYDNAHPHTANLTTLATLGWEILNHPPHSLDLAPSDYHLFGPMKEHVGEQKLAMQSPYFFLCYQHQCFDMVMAKMCQCKGQYLEKGQP
jgi:hypothetical protein